MSIDESTPMVHGVEPDESRRPRGNKKVFGHLFRKAKIVRRINKKGTYEQEVSNNKFLLLVPFHLSYCCQLIL